MRGIVIYYSFEGHTEALVEALVESYSLESLKLKPIKEHTSKGFSKYIFGGFQAVMKREPSLEPYEFDANNYDIIIFASPVWAGTYAPPLRTFFNIEKLKNKKVAFFYTHQGGHKNTKKNFEAALRDNNIVGSLDLNPSEGKETRHIDKLKEVVETWLK